MKRAIRVAAVLLLVVLGGCQAIAGLGRDMEDAATWTQERLDHGFE